MHIRKDNTSNWWRNAEWAFLLIALFVPFTFISCFSPRTNPLDPENPNADEQFGVSLDYESLITESGAESLLFTASVETPKPLFCIWRINRDDHTKLDTTESVTYAEIVSQGWNRLKIEVEVISEEGARGRDTSIVPPRWCHYDTADGLPLQSLRCMAMDSSGDLWLGGRLGLWRFGGTRFREERPYPRSTDAYFGSIYSILVGPSGAKYLGTKPVELDGKQGIVGGGLWYDHSGGWQNESPPISIVKIGNVEDLVIDRRDNLWIVTDIAEEPSVQHILFKEKGSTEFVRVDVDSELRAQEGVDLHSVGDINVGLAGSDASVWFGAQIEGGLLKFDLDTKRWHRQSIRQDQVTSLALGSGGMLWVGTSSRGLHGVSSTTSDIMMSFQERSSGIPSDRIIALASSGEHSDVVWVGTNKGLAMSDGETITPIPIPGTGTDEQPSVESLLVDDRRGVLWIGTPIGLFSHRFK